MHSDSPSDMMYQVKKVFFIILNHCSELNKYNNTLNIFNTNAKSCSNNNQNDTVDSRMIINKHIQQFEIETKSSDSIETCNSVNFNYVFGHLLQYDLHLNESVFLKKIFHPYDECHSVLGLSSQQHVNRIISMYLNVRKGETGNYDYPGPIRFGTLCKQCRFGIAVKMQKFMPIMGIHDIQSKFYREFRSMFFNNMLLNDSLIKLLLSKKIWFRRLMVEVMVLLSSSRITMWYFGVFKGIDHEEDEKDEGMNNNENTNSALKMQKLHEMEIILRPVGMLTRIFGYLTEKHWVFLFEHFKDNLQPGSDHMVSGVMCGPLDILSDWMDKEIKTMEDDEIARMNAKLEIDGSQLDLGYHNQFIKQAFYLYTIYLIHAMFLCKNNKWKSKYVLNNKKITLWIQKLKCKQNFVLKKARHSKYGSKNNTKFNVVKTMSFQLRHMVIQLFDQLNEVNRLHVTSNSNNNTNTKRSKNTKHNKNSHLNSNWRSSTEILEILNKLPNSIPCVQFRNMLFYHKFYRNYTKDCQNIDCIKKRIHNENKIYQQMLSVNLHKRHCDNKKSKQIKKLKFFKCKQCRMVYYCSRKCQKIDWVQHHRNICKGFALLAQ